MSKIISRYLTLLRQMHNILNNTHIDDTMKDTFIKIKEVLIINTDKRAIIEEITKIERAEDVRYIFEDADFSLATIKKLIKQGEDDAEQVLNEKNRDINQMSNS